MTELKKEEEDEEEKKTLWMHEWNIKRKLETRKWEEEEDEEKMDKEV